MSDASKIDDGGAAVIVLVRADDPTKKPMLYACGKCGQIQSPRIYACKDDVAHETARRAAEDCYNCKTHNNCQHCGKECEKHWLACDDCRRKKRFEDSKEVPLSSIDDECFGFDSGNFYHTPEDAAADGEDWVYASTFRRFSIDGERLEESILDDHHEDASTADFVGWDAFWNSIETFNKAQTSGSYDEDRSRRARVSHLRDRNADTLIAASNTGGHHG